EREARQPAADAADHVGLLRHQALRRVLGLLRGVAGVVEDQLHPGAPEALMPPALFTSSMAISAPICSRMPWRAQAPDSGTTRAIFTSFGACARARRVGSAAAAAVARPIL